MTDKAKELLENGATRILLAFKPDILRRECSKLLPDAPSLDKNENSAAISVCPDNPIFLSAIYHGVGILKDMGFDGIRFLAGFIVPKWRGEQRRNWHVDSWLWESADAWKEIPPQVGILYYLDDAKLDTGALLVIPKSHRMEVHGHVDFVETKTPHIDERAMPVDAGDCIVFDPRTTHAVGPNTGIDNRICLTLWYILDIGNLTEQTRATISCSTVPIGYKKDLKSLYPEYTGDLAAKAHSKKPQFPICMQRIAELRHGKSDAEIIGGYKLPQDTFVDIHETYTWYRAIGAAKAPQSILEMGVRYGYSAIALIKGAKWAGVDDVKYVGVDCEYDGIVSNDIALGSIRDIGGVTAKIINKNTSKLNAVNEEIIGEGVFDIVHIDGDHSPNGVKNELSIAKTWCRPSGLILIDDIDTPCVKEIADQFCAEYGIVPLVIPTFHGMYLVDIRKRTRFI